VNRQDFSNRRNKDKREFATGVVLLGVALVAIVWVSVFRPSVLDFISPQPAPSLPPHSSTLRDFPYQIDMPGQQIRWR